MDPTIQPQIQPQKTKQNLVPVHTPRNLQLICALRSILLPLAKNFNKSALDLANKARLIFYLGTILLHGCADADYPFLFLTSDSRLPSHGILKEMMSSSETDSHSHFSTFIGSWYTLSQDASETSFGSQSQQIKPAQLEQLLAFQKSLFLNSNMFPLPNNRYEEAMLLFSIALELYQPRIARFRTIVTHMDSAIRAALWKDALPPDVKKLYLEEGNPAYTRPADVSPEDIEMKETLTTSGDPSSSQHNNQNIDSPQDEHHGNTENADSNLESNDITGDNSSTQNHKRNPISDPNHQNSSTTRLQAKLDQFRREYQIESPKLLSLFDHIALTLVSQTSSSPNTLIETYQRAINTLKVLPSTESLGDIEFSYFGGTHLHFQLALALLEAESYDLAFLLLSQIKNALIPQYHDVEDSSNSFTKKLYHLMILRVFNLLVVSCIQIYFFSNKTSILIPETGKNEDRRRELQLKFRDLPLPPPQTPQVVWEAIEYLISSSETLFPFAESPVSKGPVNISSEHPDSQDTNSTPLHQNQNTQDDSNIQSFTMSQEDEIRQTMSQLLMSIGVLCSNLSHHGRNTKQQSISNIYPSTNTPFFSSKDKIQLLDQAQWWYIASLRTHIHPQIFVFLADLEVSPRNHAPQLDKAVRYLSLASSFGYGQNPASNHPCHPGGPKFWISFSKTLLAHQTISHTNAALKAIKYALHLFPFDFSLWLEKAIILFILKEKQLVSLSEHDTNESLLIRAISNDISLHSDILDSILTGLKCLELMESDKELGFTLADWFQVETQNTFSTSDTAQPGSSGDRDGLSPLNSKHNHKTTDPPSTSPSAPSGKTNQLHTVDSLIAHFEVVARIIISLRSYPIKSFETTLNLEEILEFILETEFMVTNRYQD